MRSDESDYGAATLLKKLIQHIDISSVLTAYAAANDAKTQDRGNLDLSRCIFEPESSNYFAERDVLAQNMVYSLFARSKCRLRVSRNRDYAISTTEFQQGDRSCLVDVSCDVDQSDIRLLVLNLESIRRWVHPGLLLT
ncbi:hypothetical protein PsorP6_003080 [Peronosclerospora sorghi]|uniref:Uncharacterized protein n=1 Tax=Peronosclerospora sorghi TaxID=230839 RepID=A0ACC0VPI5_9STRA|nr:hypothetical protein PsorP6_003080 [Peronosclerospora sorghi]